MTAIYILAGLYVVLCAVTGIMMAIMLDDADIGRIQSSGPVMQFVFIAAVLLFGPLVLLAAVIQQVFNADK